VQIKTLAIAAAVAGIGSVASADLTVFSQSSVWAAFAAMNGDDIVLTETFDSYSGFYDNPASGTLGPVTWFAEADGGLFANADYFSTNNADVDLVFTFDPGVHGVGGNFFGTDINFNVVPSLVQVSLSDGTSYVSSVDSASQFVGFYSTTSYISEIAIYAMDGSGNVWATADNLSVAVPAPGVLALLGVAGLGSRRRRG
jgi:MYXO-CTERM domain-containing protein